MSDPLRHHREHEHLHGAYGQDAFGRWAERAARLFGTPQYIVGQTVVVIVWVILNAIAIIGRWDPYPFHPPESRVLDPSRLRRAAHPACRIAPGSA